jgi:hypothetical protein
MSMLSRIQSFNPTHLGYLGFLAVPGWVVSSLRPLSFFGLFFLFWFWPYVSLLWTSSTDTQDPTNWIELGDRSYYIKYVLTQIPTMLNPFVFATSIAQLMGQLVILARYSGRLPGLGERSPTVTYRLPFDGEWTVLNGSVDKEHSHSWSLYTQRYAYDFVITDDAGRTHSDAGTTNEEYYCYGEPIHAPAEGTVVETRTSHRDAPHPGGSLDVFQRDIRGNYVTINHGSEFSVLAHLAAGSVVVEVGDTVSQGELIGYCGNSGNSTEPHLHFHVQDRQGFYTGMSLPITFESVEIHDPNTGLTEFFDTEHVSAGQRVRHVKGFE